LCPDNLPLPTPTAALAAAAAVTTDLRVGSFVLASPLRTARAAAWESHSLSVVTGDRFELGLGTGLPAMRQQAEELGLPYGSGQERLDSISETIDHVRRLDGDAHTPVMIAAGGPKARRLAGAKADIATELERRRDELGVSYVSVNSAFIEEFAPLVERLAGK